MKKLETFDNFLNENLREDEVYRILDDFMAANENDKRKLSLFLDNLTLAIKMYRKKLL